MPRSKMSLVWSEDWSFIDLSAVEGAVEPADLYDVTSERTSVWLNIVLRNEGYVLTIEEGITLRHKRREQLLLAGWMGWMESTHELWVQKLRASRGMDLTYVGEKPRPQYHFIFGGNKETAKTLAWHNALEDYFGYTTFSREFWFNFEQMQQMYGRYGEDCSEVPSIPIRISFYPEATLKLKDQIKYLRATATLLRNIQQATQKAQRQQPNRPRFELSAIELVIPSFRMCSEVVKELDVLLAMDIKIDLLDLPTRVARNAADHPTKWRSAWASLVSVVCGYPNTPHERRDQIHELRLEFDGSDDTMLFALFSLLIHTKNIKVLTMDEQFQSSLVTTSWRWIMYALFSRASTTSIHSFKRMWSEISTYCGDGGLMSVAGARYPRTQLLDDSDPSEDVNTGRVHLVPGTQMQLSNDPSDFYRVKGPKGEQFEVIRQVGDKLYVIIPAYGRGFVDSDSCPQKRQRTSNDEVARTIKPGISHLNIMRGDILRILPHFGTNLLSLRIIDRAGKESAIDHDEFAQVFSCCPQLVYLEFEQAILESLRPLVNAYYQGPRLKALRFDGVRIKDEASVVKFLQVLADPESIPAQRLEMLVMNTPGDQSFPFTVRVARALAQVVCHSPRLHLIEAFMLSRIYAEYERQLDKALNGKSSYTKCVPIPLSTRAKYAFLSTFPHCHRETQHCSQQRLGLPRHLDMRITVLVFEFAAEAAIPHVAILPIDIRPLQMPVPQFRGNPHRSYHYSGSSEDDDQGEDVDEYDSLDDEMLEVESDEEEEEDDLHG